MARFPKSTAKVTGIHGNLQSLRWRQAHSKPLPKIIDVAPTWKPDVAAGPPL